MAWMLVLCVCSLGDMLYDFVRSLSPGETKGDRALLMLHGMRSASLSMPSIDLTFEELGE